MDTAISPSQTQPDPMAELLDGFESLGGIDDQGEFAYVQRAAGLDPNGLLRWAELDEPTLIDLLEEHFEGVGERANVSVGLREGSDEWWSGDMRHGLVIRSGIKVAAVPLTRMTPRMRRRMRFLRERLLDDLAGDERIFVFRAARAAAPDAVLDRLSLAIRRHGPAHLLYVCPPDAAHPPGTIQARGPALLIATLPAPADPANPDLRTWAMLCAKVREVVGQVAPPLAAESIPPVVPSVPEPSLPEPSVTQPPGARAATESLDIDAARALAESQPTATGHWLALCNALTQAGHPAEAREAARLGVARATANAPAIIGLGETLQALDDAEGAEAAFRKAIALAPRSARPHDLLGRLLTLRNRIPEAIEARSAAEALDPGNVGRLALLGGLQLRVERPEDAVLTYRRATALAPDNVALLAQFVAALTRCDRHAEALPVAERAAALDPTNPQRHAQVANILAVTGDLTRAEAEQRRAIGLDGRHAGLRLSLSSLLHRRGRNQAAMEEAHKALSLQPNSTRALSQIARLAMAMGAWDQAEAALEKAVALEPANAGLVRQLADVRGRRVKAG